MSHLVTLGVLLSSIWATSSDVLKPRGVSLMKASLYQPASEFTCFDGSLTIPFTYINDDYCDCHDSSDEPGTSACPNGTFHCLNIGHAPKDIPSSRVNDGICDCCDGSDEYQSKKNCQDTCHEEGRSAREEADRLAEIIKQGSAIRDQLVTKGKQLKEEKKIRLEQLQKDEQEAEAIKEEKDEIKSRVEALESVALKKYKEIEEREREEQEKLEKEEERKKEWEEAKHHFKTFDLNKDEKITKDELQHFSEFDLNKDNQVAEDEINAYMGAMNELTVEDFFEKSWPNLKPFIRHLQKEAQRSEEAKKQAAQQEEYEKQQQLLRQQNQQMRGDVLPEQMQEPEVHEPSLDEEASHEDQGEEEEETDHHEEEEETGKGEVENVGGPATPNPPKYDEETQRLIDEGNKAREHFEEADRNLRDIQREKKQIEEAMNKDYGPHEEYAFLEGECFEYTDREYKYKLCPFDETSQRPKNGGAETKLGNWGKWLEDSNYSIMLYDRGHTCWNGPQRSTHVRVRCGLDNELLSVTEPNRCEYLFEFTTPAACVAHSREVHDEL
uniref:Glucosidase 2 subunit beta n=1 Tax=Cacopsylla melanoneura TaxID=428564 RepID=A0A8D8STL5_9HEMI